MIVTLIVDTVTDRIWNENKINIHVHVSLNLFVFRSTQQGHVERGQFT